MWFLHKGCDSGKMQHYSIIRYLLLLYPTFLFCQVQPSFTFSRPSCAVITDILSALPLYYYSCFPLSFLVSRCSPHTTNIFQTHFLLHFHGFMVFILTCVCFSVLFNPPLRFPPLGPPTSHSKQTIPGRFSSLTLRTTTCLLKMRKSTSVCTLSPHR